MGDQCVDVFIVDDDEPTRKALLWLMGSAGLLARAYASAAEFLAGFAPDSAGCLVLDHQMPNMTGMELVAHLRSRHIHIPTIIVTAHGDVFTAVECMKLGVADVIPKPVDDVVLLDKVRQVLQQDALWRQAHAEVVEVRRRLATLTDREHGLLEMLISGRSSKQIAFDLGISIKTVENHRAHVMAKMEATNAADLVRMTVLAKHR